MNKDINQAIDNLRKEIDKEQSIISVVFTPKIKTITVQIYDRKTFYQYAEAFKQNPRTEVFIKNGRRYEWLQFSIQMEGYILNYTCYGE